MADKMVVKERINSNLRHAEYYDMTALFDELYAKAKQGESFDNLMEMILSRENILLAYRNIKQNTGSHTTGTDGLTISNIASLTAEEVVDTVRKKVNGPQGYRPSPVRRKDIPKPNGKTRPLGIPCIWDRLIQQCIKQVLEPICEAHFSDHSYGFRPGRSAENAIADMNRNLNISKCTFVVEFDIKGFFDNVNHHKLIRQLWALGIHDKHLIFVINRILKAPIRMPDGNTIKPKKGTPQGGIISPLLANVVLNELDQWVVSQWEENPVVYKYSIGINKSGKKIKSHGYEAMRKTKLKEMHIIRYADDFRIFCKKRSDAKKIKLAVTRWLKERLHLDVSEEKTRVVNAKRKYTEFIGFKTKVKKKGTKFVTESHISDKKRVSVTTSLKQQIKRIAKPKDSKSAQDETFRYNGMVMGVQNYFRIASHVNLDCKRIAFEVNKTLENRLQSGKKGRLSRKGRKLSDYEQKRYGDSAMLRYDRNTNEPIYPIAYVKTKNPMNARHGLTPYTAQGRKLMHKELGINTKIMHQLMQSPTSGSIEYADNRISLYSAQKGKCAVTGKWFETAAEIHCHHKKPVHFGGTDDYSNLTLIKDDVHRLIHAVKKETIEKYLKMLKLTKLQIKKVNALRKAAELAPISL